jgi:predicted transcriptional regulator
MKHHIHNDRLKNTGFNKKNEKPKSITELATMMNKDAGNITKQVNKLKEKRFVDLKEGNINNMKTLFSIMIK